MVIRREVTPETVTRFWCAWIATGVIVEVWAVRGDRTGCSLSEGWRGVMMSNRVGQAGTLGLLAWTAYHLIRGLPPRTVEA